MKIHLFAVDYIKCLSVIIFITHSINFLLDQVDYPCLLMEYFLGQTVSIMLLQDNKVWLLASTDYTD